MGGQAESPNLFPEPTMSSLSNAVLSIQNDMIAAACIADFTVSHDVNEDGDESVRVHYTLTADAIEASEALLAGIEQRYGLTVARSGSSGDGFYIVYTAA